MNKQTKKPRGNSEPARKHGLSEFEEFEGSSRTSKVTTDLYAPDNYLVTKEYGIPSVLLNFEANFDRMLQEFFSKAAPDEFNCSFIDATLKCLEVEALASLDLQQKEHLNCEIPFILMAWSRGKADYTEMQDRVNTELAEVEREIRQYKHILHRGTALEGYEEA